MNRFPYHLTSRAGYKQQDSAEIRKDREWATKQSALGTLAEKLNTVISAASKKESSRE